MKKPTKIKASIIKSTISKADVSTQPTGNDAYYAGEWIEPPEKMANLATLVSESTILPQCIRAYKNNIAGFGIGIRYQEDIEETEEAAAEFDFAKKTIELLNTEQDTKEVFEDIIEARETYGIAYLEVIRNLNGEVAQIEFVRDTPSVRKTRPLEPYVESAYYYHCEEIQRNTRFCKYKQSYAGITVYFKEFGDPRIMNKVTGEYLTDGETLDRAYHANELLEFAIGTEPYGTVRWIGQVLGIDGSRRAENLNNNYFINGRHTPLMIILKNGTLTDESYTKLREYMDEVKGEAGQHAFLLLEADNKDGRTDFEQQEKPDIVVKDIANILQKDELFQEYLSNNRRKVQSAFQLPDLYVGYSTDFNRATAQTVQEVTEEQVFQPERKSLAWVINNRLLNGYKFKYVEAYFLEPNISNPDDLFQLLTVCNAAGGLTPNKAKEIVYNAYGEVAENYEGDWGDVPLAYSQQANQGLGSISMSLQKQIEKTSANHDITVAAVMREVKKLLQQLEKGLTTTPQKGIVKEGWDENAHPRDDKGRFAEGSGGNSGSADEGGAAVPAVGDFGGADVATFTSAVQAAKDAQKPEDAWRVTAMDKEKFEKEHPGACCHITGGGSVAAVTKEGDIVSLCQKPGDKIRGKELVAQAVTAGGIKLDSYDGNHGFYLKCGFEPVSWCKWDSDYAPSGWDASRDAPEDIVFYKYTGQQFAGSKEEGNAHLKTFKATIPVSSDYGAAQSARDSAIKKAVRLWIKKGVTTMFNYKNIEEYISAIREELVGSCWHYTEERANELINAPERMAWIKEAFAKQEPACDIAVDVGYCCG